MKISPPVAIGVIVVVVLGVVLFMWKGMSVGRYFAPLPMTSGLPGGGVLTPDAVKPNGAVSGMAQMTPLGVTAPMGGR